MRRAQISVADEVLQHVLPVIVGHGLAIVSTRRGDSDFHDYTLLTVEGDVLPYFCEGACPLVIVTCTVDEFEGVRRTRISGIDLAPINGVYP